MDFNSIKLDQIKKDANSLKKEKISGKDIAIIGVAANLPGADTAEKFWDNIRNKRDCIRRFPEPRKKDSDVFLSYLYAFSGTTEIEFCEGGYLDNIDQFDGEFFRIPPAEANLMDPNQRLFLHAAWEAIEDAGYGRGKLQGTNTGVYVGFSGWPVYGQLISQVRPDLAPIATAGNVSGIIAGRISYLLDLKGPAMLVDTACSSSLVAVHLACQAIRSGECGMAIAGGIKVSLIEMISRRNDGISIDASNARTRTFDDSSDGTGWGEGVAVFLLKPLAMALKDRDHIYAVIKGCAVNQDGNSIGITAPNVEAQDDVIVKAWLDGSIDPLTIGYIEAHGTGTELGDPIEIEGIKRAFERYTDRKQFCPVGSVKTNIGHLDHAAGAAGMLKAILALKHKEIPPFIHFDRPNRKIDFDRSPVYVSDRLQKWETDGFPRRCGVSSFGLSGTNCHIVIEEAPGNQKSRGPQTEGMNVLTLSARSDAQLKILAQKYRDFLRKNPEEDIRDICYTANTGRGHYSARVAFIAEDSKILSERLDEFVKAGLRQGEDAVFLGTVDTGGNQECGDIAAEKVNSYILQGKENRVLLAEICRLYVAGASIDWEKLYEDEERWKVSLPASPFEKRRRWLDIPAFEGFLGNTSIPTGDSPRIKLRGKTKDQYSPLEIQLAQIWAGALGYDEIDVSRSFYELGGDSLGAAMAVSKILKELRRSISIQEFLAAASLEELAKNISGKKDSDFRPIPKQPKKEYYEASSAQKRVYIANSLNHESTLYNQPNAFVIEGEIDVPRFNSGFEKLVARHESLRTAFDIMEGEVVQKVFGDAAFQIEYAEPENFRPDQYMEGFIRPFDLGRTPLIRVALMKTGFNQYFFAYDIHHIVADGSSIITLIGEFKKLYAGEELDPLRVQYKDFSAWQNSLVEKTGKQEEYWLQQFETGIPSLKLPIDFPRPPRQSFEGSVLRFDIGKEIFEKLHRISCETGASFFMLFYAFYSILLARYCEQENIIIGSPVAGRSHADLQNVIGMFANTIAIGTQPQNDLSFTEYIGRVRRKITEALENQDYPFEMLVDKVNIPRDLSRHPIFDVMLVYDNLQREDLSSIEDASSIKEGLKFTPFEFEKKSTKFDLLLHIVAREENFKCEFIYCSTLFKPETIEKITACFMAIIDEILNNSDIKLGLIGVSESAGGNTQGGKKNSALDAEFSF